MTTSPPGTAVVAVVDDDAGILQSIRFLLESADHSVQVFSSANAMLESGCIDSIDCLLTDIDMPGTDGFELLRIVREARPLLPVILITGHPELLDWLPWIGPEPPQLFEKPFDGQQLLTAIGAALATARSPKRTPDA